MDIISIVNTMQPNTISRFALKQTDIPSSETSIPFMGGFAVLFSGAKLPAESAVSAYQPTYAATIAAQQAAIQANAILPDIQTQVANITASLVAKGILTSANIDSNTLIAINTKLQANGMAIIK